MSRAPVLIFSRHGISSEVAKLGDRVVGYVVPACGRRHIATWAIALADWPRLSGPATSFEIARQKLIEQVEEWCVSAGLLDPGAAIVVRVETEQEERSRA